MKTLKQNGRRDAAKGAFKTDPESNNKSLPSLPPSLTFQKHRESSKENSKNTSSAWYTLKMLRGQSINHSMNT